MGSIMDIVKQELIYIWYYFSVQFEQIFGYWLSGMLIGSYVSVFAKGTIHETVKKLQTKRNGGLGIVAAGILGVASPLCMYGTIPLAASFSRLGIKDDILAAFMMSSVLLNPQLLIYSTILGKEAFLVRLFSCIICGITAGILIHFLYKNKSFFDFEGFEEPENHDTDPNLLLRFLKNFFRNVKATGIGFFGGILLSALFQRYVPAETFAEIFGEQNEGFGLLMAATIGVPLYACGGGTIPLLQQWLWNGMSLGNAAAFMITGPATKITNLGAVKIVLGMKKFVIYMIYIMAFSLLTGFFVILIL